MTRLLAAAVTLGLLGCGPVDEGAASISLALSPALLDRIDGLQVLFVKPGGSLDCARARATCASDAGLELQPLSNGDLALFAPFDRAAATGAGQPLSARVGAGTWLVLVEALDSSGRLVANGCALRVDVGAGATSAVEIALDDYAGPACAARLP